MRADRPLPDPTDALMASFWRGLANGELLVQQCPACGRVRLPPSEMCPECWTRGGGWTSVEPSGRIWSVTTYHRALHPGFAEEVPYRIALVELDSGVRLPGRLHAAPDEDVQIGARVTGVFEDIEEAVTLLSWKVAEGD